MLNVLNCTIASTYYNFYSLDSVFNKIKSCLHTIISWSSSMCLKLNADNSFLLPSLALPPPSSLSLVPPSIRSLGFILDAHLSLSPQIISVSKSCYFHLRRIKQLLPFLDDPTLQLLYLLLYFLELITVIHFILIFLILLFLL